MLGGSSDVIYDESFYSTRVRLHVLLVCRASKLPIGIEIVKANNYLLGFHLHYSIVDLTFALIALLKGLNVPGYLWLVPRNVATGTQSYI